MDGARSSTAQDQGLGALHAGPDQERPLRSGRRELLRLWLPVVAWAALIFALSSIPSLGTGLGTWDLLLRKIAHAGEYALLAVLLRRALAAPLSFLVATAYAVSDEIHQAFVPGRQGHPRDVAIDALGATVGLVVFAAWRRRR